MFHFFGIFVQSEGDPSASALPERLRTGATEAAGLANAVQVNIDGGTIWFDRRLVRQFVSSTGTFVHSGPLLRDGRISRAADSNGLDALANDLGQCRGNFCGVHFRPGVRSVAIFSDFLGTRPVYVWRCGPVVAFSTCLSVLTRLNIGRLTLNTDALLEQCTFGFPLGSRTPFNEISVIGAAEILTIDDTGVLTRNYWDWWRREVPEEPDVEALAEQAHKAFLDAVDVRLRESGSLTSLLSGGLDSRLIVASLVQLGHRPNTVSFGSPGTLDEILAQRVSGRFGLAHNFVPLDVASFESAGGAQVIFGQVVEQNIPDAGAELPYLWGGDGGSVGLGAVYLTEAIRAAAARRDWKEAAVEFAEHNSLAGPSRQLFLEPPGIAGFACRALEQSFREFEISRSDQIPYRFLLLNDQRRHGHGFYELGGTVPCDSLTPFWDPEFLKIILKCPTSKLLRHHFYGRVFAKAPAAARDVPWQAYPGHEPCPLPMPGEYSYQWSAPNQRGDNKFARRKAAAVLGGIVMARTPRRVIRRRIAILGAVLTLAGFGEYRHIIRQALVVLDAQRLANQ